MSSLARLQSLEKCAPSPWIRFPNVDAGTLITAVTTAPAYGTVGTNQAYYRIKGDSCDVIWHFKQTTTGTAGSGMYLFNLPKPIKIDLTKCKASTSTASDASFADSVVGTFHGNDSNGNVANGPVAVYSETQLKAEYLVDIDDAVWASTGYSFSVAAYMNIRASFPIKRTI